MNRCPITYAASGNKKYSDAGLRKLSPKLKILNDFPYSAEEQVKESVARASKMSIQGVQPKLSVRLNLKQSTFEIVDVGGHYIIKPQTPNYSEVPENEDLTMRLAAMIGIEIPLHGLFYSIDGSMSYFIKRFDRIGRNKKVPVEDFAQLSGMDRETKYNSSMEKVIKILDKFCTFPAIEKLKLFNLTLFNFLVGNEDMHLKNFSLVKRDIKIELSPAYDLLNSTIILNSEEEIALPINGKKSRLTKDDFLRYFAEEKLELPQKTIAQITSRFSNAYSGWIELIQTSFLSDNMKEKYEELLNERCNRLKIT